MPSTSQVMQNEAELSAKKKKKKTTRTSRCFVKPGWCYPDAGFHSESLSCHKQLQIPSTAHLDQLHSVLLHNIVEVLYTVMHLRRDILKNNCFLNLLDHFVLH